ncbi:MAG: hypothetical protein A3G25_01550 [Betaproteobacteria bacterium RIFCSPLOWO2_12_FULL_63_13]|nr:MAG: hypothetical protein A3G25_01550 [Betaproteobacteria bacterium RIFCSPLOWO2_12_FULL_63_13]
MRNSDPQASRAEIITAPLPHLMTRYARSGCPRLALYVARHMQCLTFHPDAAPAVRDIRASMHGAWRAAAEQAAANNGPLHSLFEVADPCGANN